MSPRRDALRLSDIAQSISAIQRHLKRGSIEDELVFDGCPVRLIEIGEAVKDLDPKLRELRPEVPWREIARMRDHLTHRYFDTQREIVQDVITHDIEPLQLAVAALLAESAGHDDSQTALDLDGDAS